MLIMKKDEENVRSKTKLINMLASMFNIEID